MRVHYSATKLRFSSQSTETPIVFFDKYRTINNLNYHIRGCDIAWKRLAAEFNHIWFGVIGLFDYLCGYSPQKTPSHSAAVITITSLYV